MNSSENQPAKKIVNNFEQIKAEGEYRFKKVVEILRTAIVQSAQEVKAGATEVSPASKEFRESIAQRVQETYQETLEEAQEIWANRAQEKSFQDWIKAEIQAATNAMRTTLEKKSETNPSNDK